MTRRCRRLLTIPIVIWALTAFDSSSAARADAQSERRVHFYSKECPAAREIVRSVVLKAIVADRQLSAVLLRLNFHDCFIRGCDASILLDSNFSNVAEKDGFGNLFSLRGFRVIDDAKAAVEVVCPRTVSCADIIALAARDAIVSIGGPDWQVVSGRRDGRVSLAGDTIYNLPPHYGNFSVLAAIFARKNLTTREMVVLAGAHTIGKTHCGFIQPRLYNNTGPDGVDPTLDPTYAVELRIICPYRQNSFKIVPLDPTHGNNTFDHNYFKNVQKNRGLFRSDAALVSNLKGRFLVALHTLSPQLFFRDFAAAMEKMINMEVLRAPQGAC